MSTVASPTCWHTHRPSEFVSYVMLLVMLSVSFFLTIPCDGIVKARFLAVQSTDSGRTKSLGLPRQLLWLAASLDALSVS